MHIIQKNILATLIQHETCRYRDIKPDNIESNLFMYHLRQLMGQKLVEKDADGKYQLTATGQAYVDKVSLNLKALRPQPRIATLLMATNDAGEWLLYRRHRQPLINMVGFPYGNLHSGESVQEAAERELEEKTGYRGQLEHVGDGYILIRQNGVVVQHMLFHAFCGQDLKPGGEKSQFAGESFWAKPEDVPAGELLPGTTDLIRLLRERGERRFFTELEYDL